MNTQDILTSATKHLSTMSGHLFDLLTISRPHSPTAAVNLAKVISKLSPLLGNLIEFNTVEFLNSQKDYHGYGVWKRQDPGFPDTVFAGEIFPVPGFEIKAWFPLATEITARFKDSQSHFNNDQTRVCLLAWLPEKIIYGKPQIIDVCVVSGLSIAKARDEHYHNPPDYLVIEPEDTTKRTRNLQQTNTNVYKWQGTDKQFAEARKMVRSWGQLGKTYKPTADYLHRLRKLLARYPYRLDTNFAKLDRIRHSAIEEFKSRVLNSSYNGLTIQEWSHILVSKNEMNIKSILKKHLKITEAGSERILA